MYGRQKGSQPSQTFQDITRVSGLSSDPRDDRLSGRRDRYGAAGSAPSRRGERQTRGRIGDSTRVFAGVGWMFEHPKARTTQCSGRIVA